MRVDPIVMDLKKEFTKLIMESKAISKKDVDSVTTDKTKDGAGAIVITQRDEACYDLRPPKLKGVLAKSHPVRIAAEINPANTLDSILQSLAEYYEYEKAVVEPAKAPFCAKLYENSTGVFPSGFKKTPRASIELEKGLALTFGGQDLVQAPFDRPDFYGMYLEYAHLVLFNHGRGRIAGIEKIAISALPSNWKVKGCWIKAPEALELRKLWKNGIMATEEQANEGAFCLPNSGFDYQYQDMLTRLLKAKG